MCLGLGLAAGGVAEAQTAKAPDVANPATVTKPPVVESTPEGPMQPPAAPPVADSSVESSPVSPLPRGVAVPAHTEIDVRLARAIDSTHVKNGDMVGATLTAPVKLSDGHVLGVGTRVGVTVLAVAAAGKVSAHGEVTLQVTHVGSVGVLSEALTFLGKDGPKDLPDSAPKKGTEASVNAGTTLKFHVPALPR